MEVPSFYKYIKSYSNDSNSSNASNASNSNLEKPYKKIKNNLEFLVKEMELNDENIELTYKKELFNSIYYIVIISVVVWIILLI